jgi:hypothetical protein
MRSIILYAFIFLIICLIINHYFLCNKVIIEAHGGIGGGRGFGAGRGLGFGAGRRGWGYYGGGLAVNPLYNSSYQYPYFYRYLPFFN